MFGPYWRCSSSRQSLGYRRRPPQGSSRWSAPGTRSRKCPGKLTPTMGISRPRASSRAISPSASGCPRRRSSTLSSSAACGRNGVKSSWAKPRSFMRRSRGCPSSLTGNIGKPRLTRCCRAWNSAAAPAGSPLDHVRRRSTAPLRTARAVNVADRRKSLAGLIEISGQCLVLAPSAAFVQCLTTGPTGYVVKPAARAAYSGVLLQFSGASLYWRLQEVIREPDDVRSHAKHSP